MSLSRIVFYTRNLSKEQDGSHADVIKGILQSCRQHDNASGITGALIFDRRYILQAMEGDRTLLSSRIRNLSADERHGGLTLMSFGSIDVREFTGWTVGYAGHEETTDRLYMLYGSLPEFDPTRMSEVSALHLLREFSCLESKFVQRSAPLVNRTAAVALDGIPSRFRMAHGPVRGLG